MKNIPVQYLSAAILLVNILQLIVQIRYRSKKGNDDGTGNKKSNR